MTIATGDPLRNRCEPVGRHRQRPQSATVDEDRRTLLDREGGRTLVDGASGDTLTLRELYAAAGAKPDTKVDTVAEALAPLEGAKLDVPGLRVVRGAYEGLIDKHGLDQLDASHGGAPAAATQLPAHALRDVENESAVAKYVAKQTIGEIASASRERFVADATKGLKGTPLAAEKKRAEKVWANATSVAKISRAWGT